jgi:DNA-binding protein H-NS
MAKALHVNLNDLSWLSDLSYEQLSKLADAIQTQLNAKRHQAKEELRNEFMEKARLYGFDPAEIVGRPPKARGGTRGEVKPKYRHPGNPKLQWSGRGLPPGWMRELIEQGRKKEDFLINE